MNKEIRNQKSLLFVAVQDKFSWLIFFQHFVFNADQIRALQSLYSNEQEREKTWKWLIISNAELISAGCLWDLYLCVVFFCFKKMT